MTISSFEFFDIGFHGDRFLIDLVFCILELEKANCFIETGTNTGSTLAYVAKNFSNVKCFSCEPRPKAVREARKNCKGLNNIDLRNEFSPQYLAAIVNEEPNIINQNCVFWLDAHGQGFQWPLRQEINFITNKFQKGWIFIDDFYVPGRPLFGYDEYDGQICSYNYIKDYINKSITYRLFYPNYEIRTSKHHPLRGWGLIEFGNINSQCTNKHFCTMAKLE